MSTGEWKTLGAAEVGGTISYQDRVNLGSQTKGVCCWKINALSTLRNEDH